ncbi:MAG: hypothetical protein LBB94_08260 [Clostridiales bacterium]|jgi:hypothetical protein|nr:hypothetical protein [Clostridiales bacterium]
MEEHKNLKIIGAIAVIVICAIAGGLHYMTRILRVSETDINMYASKTGVNPRRKHMILQSILLNTGQWRDWGSMDQANVSVILSRIKGRQKDAIIVARGGNGKNVVALYEKYNGSYLYTAMVDTFDDLRDLQIMPLREQGGSLIVVRDHSSNTLEDIMHVRAYAWDEGKFQNVLNITENYKAFYNELWDGNKPASSANWIRVYERSDIIWENSDAPVVHVMLHQNYGLSGSVNQRERPDETDFDIVRNRDILEDYIWSGKWMHFILFEGTDRENGEPVAVIDDLSGSPFGLIGQFDKASGKYRVKYLDGAIETVEKERIKPGIEIKKTRRM